MSTSLRISTGITSDLATILAAGILRLCASPVPNLPDSTAASLELPAPALLSVTPSPAVNRGETSLNEGSDR